MEGLLGFWLFAVPESFAQPKNMLAPSIAATSGPIRSAFLFESLLIIIPLLL